MKETIKEKRKRLIEMSNTVKPLVASGEYPNINAAIIEKFYKSTEHGEFRSFNGWRKEGKQVKRGSTGFIVWGRPKSAQDAEKGVPVDDEAKAEFYPLAYVFSNSQVN